MNNPVIRPFQPEDAAIVSELICRALREVNSRDYPPEEIERLVLEHAKDHILQMASEPGWMFVAMQGDLPVGVLRALPSWEEEQEYWLRTVFVSPALQGLGIGRRLVAAGEHAVRKAGATRICLCASQTAHGFYQKLGYHDIIDCPDVDGLYPMEKRL